MTIIALLRSSVSAGSAGLTLVGALAVISVTSAPASAQKVHNTYGSPLDTLMNTHLTTDVPEAQDFVRQTSPDRKALDYTPLTGTDPDRPKPRDLKQVEALQAELEAAGARNEKKAKGLLPTRAGEPHKSKSTKATAADPSR